MAIDKIVGIGILAGLWLFGLGVYIFAWIRTKTVPFELSDDELFSKAFGGKEKTE